MYLLSLPHSFLSLKTRSIPEVFHLFPVTMSQAIESPISVAADASSPKKRALPDGYTFKRYAGDMALHRPLGDLVKSKEVQELGAKLAGINAYSIVIDPKTERILLLKRARKGNRKHLWDMWEVPGGKVDTDDPTIIHGAARELFEESGLLAVEVKQHITAWNEDNIEHVAKNDVTRTGGKVVASLVNGVTCLFFAFEMGVDWDQVAELGGPHEQRRGPTVKLDPQEHTDFVWASKEEIACGYMDDGMPIPLARGNEFQGFVIHEVFRRRDGRRH